MTSGITTERITFRIAGDRPGGEGQEALHVLVQLGDVLR